MPAPTRSPAERRSQAALDALRGLMRDQLVQTPGIERPSQPFRLQVDLCVDPSRDWACDFDPPLAQQLEDGLAQACPGLMGLPSDAVYDFREQTSTGTHCRPPDPSMVFRGYSATGVPQYTEFAQWCVDIQHPDVHCLYEDEAPWLCGLRYGKDLKAEQMAAFGKTSQVYTPLGLIAAGYLRVPADVDWPEPFRRRTAMGFLFLEARSGPEPARFRLQTLCGGVNPDQLDALLFHPRMHGLYRARKIALQELEAISMDVAAARKAQDRAGVRAARGRVGPTMRSMLRHLERGSRQSSRRTHHAESRRQSGGRPVPQALRDARAARPDQVFVDEKKETFALRGKAHRAHVFTADGRHVTSFELDDDAVAFRVRTGRWRPATAGEAEALLTRLRRAREAE